MTALKSALVQSGVVNIPEILKKEFFNCIRLDKGLRSIFTGKSPDTEKRAYSYGVNFNTWIYQYNHWGKTANKWAIPEHMIPTDIIDCAEMFGYKGKKELLPAWEYIKYLLQEEWIREFVSEDESEPSIRELTLSTLALVQGIMWQDKDKNANSVRELQVKQLLMALWVNVRWTRKVDSMITRAIEELKKWDESQWNQEEIMNIAQSIVKNIK